MQKRYITFPEPVLLVSIEDRKVVDPQERPVVLHFFDFLKGRLADPIFGVCMQNVVAQQALLIAFSGKKPGDVVELDEDDWAVLHAATEKPHASRPYQPELIGSALSFWHAIKNARSEKPPAA